MYIIAIGWMWVVFMMSITQKSILAGVSTFIFYGLLPCSLLIYLLATPGRRRRQAKRELESQATSPAISQDAARQVFIDGLIENAIAAIDADRLHDAESIVTNVLEQVPNEPRGLHLRGLICLKSGDPVQAESNIRQALEVDATPAIFWFNLGHSLLEQQKAAEAAEGFEQALIRDPHHVPSLYNLGKIRAEQQCFDASIDAFQRLTKLLPDDVVMQTELGIAHLSKAKSSQQMEHMDEAIAHFRQVLAMPALADPVKLNARVLLGDALIAVRRHAEALAHCREWLAQEPNSSEAVIKCAYCLLALGQMTEAAGMYQKAIALLPGNMSLVSSLIHCNDYRADLSEADVTAQRLALGRQFGDVKQQTTWENPRLPVRRLRVGYVSADLYQHVVVVLLEPVWHHHDREQFEWFVYDASDVKDEKNTQLRALMPNWRDIQPLDANQVAALIEQDQIDILIDLGGHTSGNRLEVFARKPAPLAASWLGYPGSTALSAIDYLISDAHTSPPALDGYVSETVIRLPETRLTYSPPAGSPAPTIPAASCTVTFGCFNNISKLNREVFGLWGRILNQVSGSRLLLKSPALDDPEGRDMLLAEAEAAGVDRARLSLRGRSNYGEMLAQYGEVDIALDPFPFCGGLTSLDALWMGVPVVTLEGKLMAGRQTLAFLQTIGQPELVASSPDEYVRLAVELARDPKRIAMYRANLRAAMQASPLLDHERLTRHLERAYRDMWRTWCDSGANAT